MNQKRKNILLSHPQKRIYYTEKLFPHTSCNIIAFTVRYERVIDQRLLEKSINHVIKNNDALRLRISPSREHNKIYQYLSTFDHLHLDFFDFSGIDGEIRLNQWLQHTTSQYLPFFDSPLYYFACIKFNEKEWGYYMKIHHFISDGGTLYLLASQINSIYEFFEKSETADLQPQPSYLHYIDYEREYLKSEKAQEDKKFWLDTFQSFPENIDWGFKNDQNTNIKASIKTLCFPGELREKMLSYCNTHRTSLFKLILSALSIYISRRLNTNDFLVGSANHNRTLEIHQKTMGMFVSTLPLRIKTNEKYTFSEFVNQVGKNINNIVKNHQRYPFDLLAKEIRETSGKDLMEAMAINLVGHPDFHETTYKMQYQFHRNEPHPLTIHFNFSNKNISGILELDWAYQEESITPEEVEQIHKCLTTILDDALTEPEKQLQEIQWISDEEYKQILFHFNQSPLETDFPSHKTICHLFMKQVEQIPDRVALAGELGEINSPNNFCQISYSHLNRQTNKMAHLLRSNDEFCIGTGSFVAVLLQQSIARPMAVLSVLKARGAYIPIDPALPLDRIRYILNDASVNMVLSQNNCRTIIRHMQKECPNIRFLDINTMSFHSHAILPSSNKDFQEEKIQLTPPDSIKTKEIQPSIKYIKGEENNFDTENGSILNEAESPAYIIYTSGSTGIPKGVIISHRSLVNLCFWHIRFYKVSHTDRATQFAGFGFDASILEIFPHLISGVGLYLIPANIRMDIGSIKNFLITHSVTICFLPTQLCEHFMADPGEVPTLRALLTGGEKLNRYVQKNYTVYNNYGPTETTVVTTATSVTKKSDTIHIGSPVSNTYLFILNPHSLKPLPIGITGELYIGGVGLSLGYLNLPELTSEKFLGGIGKPREIDFDFKPDAMRKKIYGKESIIKPLREGNLPARSKIYKTGDQVRWLRNGNIEFLGRMDFQVKIRGYRIELGEIENRLLHINGISDAAVMVQEFNPSSQPTEQTSNKYLFAYYVQEKVLPVKYIKNQLGKNLPDYMIPTYFIKMEQMPLNASGKIDRNKLRIPNPQELNNQELKDLQFFEPTNPIEKRLTEIWRTILKKDIISINSNFFHLGGHSLNAIEINVLIRKCFNVEFPVPELFKNPTVKTQAKYIANAKFNRFEEIRPVEEREYYPMSSAQKRIFLLEKMESGESLNYNIPTLLTIKGHLDLIQTRQVFFQLLNRHESLRTAFFLKDGNTVQMIRPFKNNSFNITVMETDNNETNKKTLIRPFILNNPPLIRVSLLKPKGDNENYFLFLDMHHIISDKVSMELLLKDFTARYLDKNLTPIKIRYRDYTLWQHEFKEKYLSVQEQYWLRQFSDEIPILDLPLDYPRPKVQSFAGAGVLFNLEGATVSALRNLALSQEVTLYMVLLSLFYLLLSKITGQEDIVIGTPVSGRQHADLQHIVGMFINTLALRNFPIGDKPFHTFLAQVKDQSLEAFENQDYQFEDLVEKLILRRDPSHNPLFDVAFSFTKLEVMGMENENDTHGVSFILNPREQQITSSKFDLSLAVDEAHEPNLLYLTLEYCTCLFKAETIHRLKDYYINLIHTVISDITVKLSDIDLISAAEKSQILKEFNQTRTNYPKEKTVQRIFEEQVEQTPDHIAISSHDNLLSYNALNELAKSLVPSLQGLGVGPDKISGILAQRQPEAIIGMLAILRSGGAYLPLSLAFGPQRIRFILNDSNAVCLLNIENEAEINEIAPPCPVLQYSPPQKNPKSKHLINTPFGLQIPSASWEKQPHRQHQPSSINGYFPVGPRNLAYVIYTSGTTGNPKGVLVEHLSAVNEVTWFHRRYRIHPGVHIIQMYEYIFDASVAQIFATLLYGGTLFTVLKENLLDMKELRTYIDRRQINIIDFIPQFNEELFSCPQKLESIKTIICGAEKLEEKTRQMLLKKGYEIHNSYGPTEATVDALASDCRGQQIDLGSPVDNCGCYILDQYGRPVPIGVTGELYIGGVNVARGYLNHPELTAEKYITISQFPHLADDIPYRILYKSGDLVRRLPNGRIVFFGRIDHQVKIHGHRIELGEIEAHLSQIKGIKEVIVTARQGNLHQENSDKERNESLLCAYYTSNQDLADTFLRSQLEKNLPDYMIPASFVWLEKFPQTPGGKIDRKLLPTPNQISDPDKEYTKPNNELEIQLLGIWQKILGIEKIGIHDNFFELGGNSMRLLKLQSEIDEIYPQKIKVVNFFNYTTIAKQAEYIKSKISPENIKEDKVNSQTSFRESIKRGNESRKPKKYSEIDDQSREEIDIAIIGLGLKIKDTDSADKFWQYLAEGRDCIGEIPEKRRRDIESLFNQEENRKKHDYQVSAYLEEIDTFDYGYFNLSPREASLMDPNQRLFLQTAYSAIEDAGYGGRKLYGTDTGVFIGFSSEDERYKDLVAQFHPGDQGIAMAGNVQSIIASRISYLMDLKGPAIVVDTACSSGLVAVHYACRSIRSGECSQAIAGAVKIKLTPFQWEFDVDILSADGKTRTFDENSDGTGSGEGVIAILLKPLQHATADGDRILSVIKGSAINQDGNSIGITAPNAKAQTEVIVKAWQDADIDPLTISYIEAHGTATKLGDPIEIEGITNAFAHFTDKKQFCRIGSVKANIGHLDNAAGMAGLLKAVLCIKHRQIPPLVHFNKPNPQIDFENSPVYINKDLCEWKTNGFPLRCGISSFGLSGTNCHLVLEEPPLRTEPVKTTKEPQIFTLSGKTPSSLIRQIQNHLWHLKHLKEETQAIENICYTVCSGRGHYNYRLALVVKSLQDLTEKLQALSKAENKAELKSLAENINNVFYGYFRMIPLTKKEKSRDERNEEDIEKLKRETLNAFQSIGAERLIKMAQLYTQGADIHWEAFYDLFNRQYFKVGLPPYSFEPTRCWLELHTPSASVLPLLDKCVVESMSHELYTTIFSPKKFWLLHEHRVEGIPVLVGTAFLEMAWELWQRHQQGEVLELQDMTIITPLSVKDGESKEVQVILEKTTDPSEFNMKVVGRIQNTEEKDNLSWAIYANGALRSISEPKPLKYDIQDIISSHNDTLKQNPVTSGQNGFISVSDRWLCLKTIYTGKESALAYLELTERYHDDLKDYYLHPPILDAALHYILALKDTDIPYLPMLYQSVRIYGPTPAAFYSLIKPISQIEGDELMVYDITLMDTSGKVFAEFDQYTLKKVRTQSLQPDMYFDLQWVINTAPHEVYSNIKNASLLSTDHKDNTSNQNGRILILVEKNPIAWQIIDTLTGEGKEIVIAQWGNEFKKKGDQHFIIDGGAEDYERLLEELSEQDITDILYMTALPHAGETEPASLKELEQLQERSLLGLFRFTQSLIKKNVAGLDILLVVENAASVTGNETHISPFSASLVGLAKVISQEYPHLKCRCIDIDEHTEISSLLPVIENKTTDFNVAFREGNQYVEQLTELDWGKIKDDQCVIKEGGVYLITGGLGGIGLQIAQYLTTQANIKLAMVSRTPLHKIKDKDTRQKLKTIEETDSEVLYLSADVSDPLQMEQAVEKIHQTWGSINGIVHCAGLAGDGFLMHKTEKVFRQVTDVKIIGTWLLETLTRSDNPDFFVLCSSLTVLTGFPGQGDYTAANYYLDAFAQSQSLRGRKFLAIDWGTWKETGMAVKYGAVQDDFFKTLSNREGIAAFHAALNKKIDRVMIGTFDYNYLIEHDIHLPVRLSPEMQEKIKLHENNLNVNKNQRAPQRTQSKVNITLMGRSDHQYTAYESVIGNIWGHILGYKEMDIDDNFYQSGGDSINALNIINQINKELQTEITVADIFIHPTIRELAAILDTQMIDPNVNEKNEKFPPLLPVKKQSYYPVSAAQKRLFILNCLDQATTGYNLPEVLVVEGSPDVQQLEKAIKEILRRHETLRTSFTLVAEQPVQVVHPWESVNFSIPVTDISNHETLDLKIESETNHQYPLSRATTFISDFIRPFDLSLAPLFRVELLKVSAEQYFLLTDIHHIIADAMGCEILTQELIALYNGETLPQLPIQYRDFAAWQNRLFESNVFVRQEKYWLEQFKGTVPLLELPTDFPRPQVQSFAGDVAGFTLDSQTLQKAREFVKHQGITMYMLILAVYYSILHRYSGQEDIVIGTATSGRSHADVEKMIGMFVNILALRNYPNSNKSFTQFLEEVKTNALQSYENQDYPFDQLVEKLNIKRDLSHSPLVDVEFSYMSFDQTNTGKSFSMGNLILHPYEGQLKQSSKCDITLFCVETDTLIFNFEYCSALFKKERMEQLSRHFKTLINRILETPETTLGAIDFLSDKERQNLLTVLNHTETVFPGDKTISNLFKEIANNTPDRIALVDSCGDDQTNKSEIDINNKSPYLYSIFLSYDQVNKQAGEIENSLYNQGIAPGSIVGLLMGASAAMVMTILGILKAGAAYLPIDQSYPQDRIDFILRDSSAQILLKDQSNPFSSDPREWIQMISLTNPADLMNQSDINPKTTPLSGKQINNMESLYHSQEPVYIIYTSGSTGKPKGVVVEHHSLINLCFWHIQQFSLTCNDHTGKYAGVAFDASVWEIFPTLMAGAALYIIPQSIQLDIEKLNQFFNHHIITVAFLPTQVCEEFMAQENHSLRILLTGGDKLNRYLPTPYQVVNNYGPTEHTVVTTSYPVESTTPNIPIGKPIHNTQIFILDYNKNIQPIGIPGELFITGAGIARGYLNRPELTAQRFIKLNHHKNLMQSIDQKTSDRIRLYQTGDWVRWNFDGHIEFLNRIDQQVKIRGFRIELGEIENKILEYPLIKDTVVTVRSGDQIQDNNKFLCAFYISAEQINANQLKSFLAQDLPEYMIPAYFIPMEGFPLTPNGKLDLKALSGYTLPVNNGKMPTNEPRDPSTPIEHTLAEIWKKILNLPHIDTNQNFFDMGGNSLLIIKLGTMLKRELHIEIPNTLLFRFPTIQLMGQYLQKQMENNHQEIPTLELKNIEEKREHLRVENNEIAIIGMAGRFPGATGIDQFQQNLESGVEAVLFFNDAELEKDGIDPLLLNNSDYIKADGFLENAQCFDADFFGYTLLEAQLMDPQVRIFHECIYEALENAGYHPSSYNGSIGLYAGASSSLSWAQQVMRSEQLNRLGLFGAINLLDRDFMCTRISYNLHLNGPSLSIQTACSTSLTALHHACCGLKNGDCTIALAGGVSLQGMKKTGYLYEEGMIMSPDGHCRAFDARANGTVFGSGAGVVVLKPLELALQDHDHIFAVIKGSAVNNDGKRKVGYNAPSIEGQAQVIRSAQKSAGVSPETITFVETHGTGTPLGDPVEIEALNLAFNTPKRGYCALGSVKTCIGHLDAAAGIAGLIKTVLALYNRILYPNLNFESPNPAIDFDNSPFYVNTRLRQWKNNGHPLRAGVSSFGIGGTNAHVILEEPPDEKHIQHNIQEDMKDQLLLLSAQSKSALSIMTSNLNHYLLTHPTVNLADVAYTLQVGRGKYTYKKLVVCTSINEAIDALTMSSEEPSENPPLLTTPGINLQPIFMFPGQGAQYKDMGWGLYQTQPLFRKYMDLCFDILSNLLDYDIKKILYPAETPSQDMSAIDDLPNHLKNSPINQTEVVQPLIFSIEYAMSKLLIEWGIQPYAMVGHSIGEFTAACLSGVFTLEQALKLVVKRGQLMQSLASGSMLSVPLAETQLIPLLKNHPQISLAAVNSPNRCVASGTHHAIDSLEADLKEKGHDCRKLHTSHAFHSAMMDPILEEFQKLSVNTSSSIPQIPYISNLSGNWITGQEATSPEYWPAHLRGTVRFADGIANLLKLDHPIFIEVGPGNVLSTFTRMTLAGRQAESQGRIPLIVNLLRHPKEKISDEAYLLKQVGQLWSLGLEIKWEVFHSGHQHRRIPLPTYPFAGKSFRLEPSLHPVPETPLDLHNHLKRKPDMRDWFYVPTWEQRLLPEISISRDDPSSASWLIFTDKCGVGNALIQYLKQHGIHVITVSAGQEFSNPEPDQYILHPNQSADYQLLIRDLAQKKRFPNTILHMWNITGRVAPAAQEELEEQEIKPREEISWNENKILEMNHKSEGNNHSEHTRKENIEKYLQTAYFSILEIARAIGNENITGDIKMAVISNGLREVTGEEKLEPLKALLSGVINVIPVEYPNIRCSNIDIRIPKPGSPEETILIHQIINEVKASLTDPVVALRKHHRWIQVHRPFPLEKPTHLWRLKQRGVYLITGGLGGIGMSVAKYLAQQVNARLILVSRSEFPPRQQWSQWLKKHSNLDPVVSQILQLKEMESYGAEIMIAAADITDFAAMNHILSTGENQMGPINGIIHAAGVADFGGFIQNRNIHDDMKIMASKITGTLTLGQLIKNRNNPLDLFVLCSSLGNQLPLSQAGQVAYNSANEFLEAFATSQASSSHGFIAAINWPQWSEVGMAAKLLEKENKIPRHALEDDKNPPLQLDAITPEEGTKIFERIIHSHLTRVSVSTQDLNSLQKAIHQLDRIAPPSTNPETTQQNSASNNSYIHPHNAIENRLKKIWIQFFGHDSFGITDNFFTLGGDSLLALRVISAINHAFDTKLPANLLLENGTIKAIARLMKNQKEENPFSSLVRIQAGSKNKIPIFLVHPIGGHVYFYRSLAEAIGTDQPVYGLQAKGLDGKNKPLTSIEEMAKHYIQEIYSVQPMGPYHLGGASFGGMVAFEMAQQLKRAGHEVDLLFMIDTPGPGHMPKRFADDSEILVYYLRTGNKEINITPEQFRAMHEVEQQALMQKHLALLDGGIETWQEIQQILKVFHANFEAMYQYSPKIFTGHLIYFRAMEESEGNSKTPEQAWLGLTTDAIDIYDISGDHITMNDPPHVNQMGKIIKSYLPWVNTKKEEKPPQVIN